MFIHGVRPGPLIMIEFPSFVYEVVVMVLLASAAMLILGLSMVKWLVKVLAVPREKLMPIIFVLCVVGAFAIQSRTFDIGVMVFFGIVGYFLREMDYPMAPLILGIILGSILDKNLRRSLILADGHLAPFFNQPIGLVLFLVTLLVILSKMKWFQKLMTQLKNLLLSPFRKNGGA
jgi:putative tricarboxylic transport membrane protein